MSGSEVNHDGYKIRATHRLRDSLDGADLDIIILENGTVRFVAVLNGKRVKIPRHIVWEYDPEVVRHTP